MIVTTRSLTKCFGDRTAVDGLDLDVPRGTCFGLLGPNGAGKTTTLRMVYGVTRPTGGTIRIFGIDVAADPRAVRARLGVTLQDTVLIDELSPRDNLRVFGRYHLLREPELSRRADELIDFLELRSHADVPARLLSGGFRRRLAIAQSMLNRPELLVLDEPTTGLDPAVRLGIWASIRDLKAAGTTVLLTTHYMDEAERLCDRVAIMTSGKVVAEDAPAALIMERLAPEALELDCAPTDETDWMDRFAAGAPRLRAGNRTIVYVDDAAALAEKIRTQNDIQCPTMVTRPANLEDVFLSLTGTTLERGA